MKFEGLDIFKYFLFLIIVIIFYACSSAKNYKVLSFFFDGVENPNEVAKVGEDSTSADSTASLKSSRQILPVKPQYYLHSPFEDRDCKSCHNTLGSNRLNQPQPQLCYECHDDFQEEYTELHGPVASGYCTACHNPHKSKNEKLLVFEKQELCIYCHDQAQILSSEQHEGIELSECLDCHNPHGGEDKFFMN